MSEARVNGITAESLSLRLVSRLLVSNQDDHSRLWDHEPVLRHALGLQHGIQHLE